MDVVSVSLGFLGVTLVALCTHRYGVGLSPDSANYVSAANSLLAGQGYRYFDGGIYTHWPPLFPTLLAIPGLAGIAPATAARWVNALAFGGIVFFAGRLFARCTTSGGTAVLGTLSVLLSVPLLAVSSMAWSEPVFILLAVLFVLYLPRFFRTKRWVTLAVLACLVGLACLERYAGVTLIVTGGLVIATATPKASILDRLKYSAGFCLLSVTPLVLWFLRNRVLAGQTAGAHHLNWRTLGEMGRPLVAALDIMATWFSPWALPGSAGMAVVGVIVLSAGAVVLVARWRFGECGGRSLVPVWSAAIFVLVYTGFIAFTGAGLSWDPEQRHMSPVYVFIMLLVFIGMEDAFRLLIKGLGHRALLQASSLVLMALWLLHPLDDASEAIKHALRDGAGEYSTGAWRQSAIMQWLRTNPPQGSIYSNAPDAIYLLTGTAARETPHWYIDTTQFAEGMISSQSNYVVWSHNLRRDYLYDLRELASRWRLEPVAALPDGEVYRFLGVGGSELFGVYRFWSPQRQRHLYTLDKRERDGLVLRHAREWVDEGAVFYAYSKGGHPPGARPVYRLWSQAMQTSFYTIDPAEKDTVLENVAGVWEDQGVAWYAFAEGEQPPDASPVHRFWSGTLGTHLYTIDQAEKDGLVTDFAHVWTYEGVAWYAYGK